MEEKERIAEYTKSMSKSPNEPSTETAQNAAGRQVVVLYNCDFDLARPEDAKDAKDYKDRSAVAKAAHDIHDAINAYGYDAQILGVGGVDIAECLLKLRKI